MASLKEIEELLKQQGNDWRQVNDRLLELVQQSTSATTEANVLNRELREAISKVRLHGLSTILTSVAQVFFYVVIGLGILFSLSSGRNIEITDLIKITQPDSSVETTTKTD